MKMQTVRVLRAFYFGGKVVQPETKDEPADEIEVPAIFAAELVLAKKAEIVEPPAQLVEGDDHDA